MWMMCKYRYEFADLIYSVHQLFRLVKFLIRRRVPIVIEKFLVPLAFFWV